jgi:hypothetical protein
VIFRSQRIVYGQDTLFLMFSLMIDYGGHMGPPLLVKSHSLVALALNAKFRCTASRLRNSGKNSLFSLPQRAAVAEKTRISPPLPMEADVARFQLWLVPYPSANTSLNVLTDWPLRTLQWRAAESDTESDTESYSLTRNPSVAEHSCLSRSREGLLVRLWFGVTQPLIHRT